MRTEPGNGNAPALTEALTTPTGDREKDSGAAGRSSDEFSFRFHWTRAIRADAKLSPMQKLVGFALATRMKADGRCWPSQETIAKDTGASRTTVKAALKGLTRPRRCYLRRRGGLGRGHVTHYQATLPAETGNRQELPLLEKGRETTLSGEKGSGDDHEKGRETTTKQKGKPKEKAASSLARAEGGESERFAEADAPAPDAALDASASSNPSGQGSEPPEFTALMAELQLKGKGRSIVLKAWGEDEDAPRALAAKLAELRARPGVNNVGGLLITCVREGDWRERGSSANGSKSRKKTTPREYVIASGWQLEDDDLAEVLGRDYRVEGPEKLRLMSEASAIREARRAAAREAA